MGRELWGGTRKGIVDGDDPLYVSGSMYPTLDDINNLGSADNRWNDLYLSGILQGTDADFTGNVDFTGATVTGLAISGDYLPLTGGTLSDDLIITGSTNFLHVDGFASIENVTTFGGGYSDPGVTISAEGDISMGGNLVVDGTVDGVDLSSLSSTYLPLAGGTMSGDLNLGSNDINNVDTVNVGVKVDALRVEGTTMLLGNSHTDYSSVDGTLRITPYDNEPYSCPGAAFTEGMLWYEDDTDTLWICTSSNWEALN